MEAIFVALVLLCAAGECRSVKVTASTIEECRAAAQAVAPDDGETRTIMPCVKVERQHQEIAP